MPKLATMELIVVTGQSGSGKSTVLRALEDEGCYCVDNLPAVMVEQLVAVVAGTGQAERLALGLDVRSREYLGTVPALVARLRAAGHRVRILFLSAQPEAMIRRFATTRRVHPLDDGRDLGAALAEERRLLTGLDELAEETWDTSALTPHALRKRVEQVFGAQAAPSLGLVVLSFGFKYGVPPEANLLFDVRFVANPYFDPELRPMSGQQAPVARAVLADPDALSLIARWLELMVFLLPRYLAEGKRLLYLGIGCTGGRHRSVAMAERLGELLPTRLSPGQVRVRCQHRDLDRDSR